MDPTTIETIVRLVWLASASCFVIGLMRMNSPATARNGNLVSAAGMAAAIAATAVLLLAVPSEEGGEGFNTIGWAIILAGIALGGGLGLYTARTVKMTAMPQLVSLFNAVGGGAAALIAIDDYLGLQSAPAAQIGVATVLDIVIGSITFTGSLIASGKLMGLSITPSRPVIIPGGRIVTAALALIVVVGAVYLWAGNLSVPVMFLILAASLIFGVTMTLPIGGADMPVVISLLNSFTGTAVAMAGFVLGNDVLIIAGALVGASGAILTKLMADAMNRSVMNIMIGGFGGGEGTAAEAGAGGSVRSIGADDVAIQLAYAQHVIVVPGYGLAVAQAQHAVRELADLLEERGVDVKYAIHPVAGRMPGHMNVLLAEANVPYPQLKEMEEINPEFERADVALVIGANDVTNPAARRPGSPVSGMPILDVDKAKSIVVIKRSMGRGYAGIDNELYTNPKTGMLFADAKQGLADLVSAVKAV
ncbi:MAG TPA: NAD(P)(+) transhydrogenase (Re/Si-specific) subunit beta [Candidatus Limnocylindrales bacterium]|nr:NAD(P)(+) transhydrogenase (Re/Si-specific) subunit beta [Candidatus Limnocylindrales bacterium]